LNLPEGLRSLPDKITVKYKVILIKDLVRNWQANLHNDNLIRSFEVLQEEDREKWDLGRMEA
jgi:hypothetical protein